LALGNLGDLEDVSPSRRDKCPLELFTQAVTSARNFYSNTHVNPYTYLGSYHYRKNNYRDALYNWAQAATAISQYVSYLCIVQLNEMHCFHDT
jgi:menin